MDIPTDGLTIEGETRTTDMKALLSALSIAEDYFAEEDIPEYAAHMKLLRVRLAEGNPVLFHYALENEEDLDAVLDDAPEAITDEYL